PGLIACRKTAPDEHRARAAATAPTAGPPNPEEDLTPPGRGQIRASAAPGHGPRSRSRPRARPRLPAGGGRELERGLPDAARPAQRGGAAHLSARDRRRERRA